MTVRYDWETLYSSAGNCNACGLCDCRNNVVIGTGDPTADVMLIGEGPGYDEDMQGIPFVGKAGQLLDRILAAVDVKRGDVYIANIVKCRPPSNRVPTDSEAEACLPFLRAQFALVSPKIIVCMGATAAKHIIGPGLKITRDRGNWIERKGIWILPTYHPAALLRDETKKRPVWEDFKSMCAKAREIKAKI